MTERGFTLRADQTAAAMALFASIQQRQRKLCVMPTGSGKSVVIAEVVRLINANPKRRIIILSHSADIVTQNIAAIRRHLPSIDVTCACSGAKEKISYAGSVVVSSIQTYYGRFETYTPFDIIIVDEAHLISTDEESMYRRVFAGVKANVPIVGLTATPYRLDTGYLHQGPGALFDGICHETSVSKLIGAKKLAPVLSEAQTTLDTSSMQIASGDFVGASYTAGATWESDTATALSDAVPRLNGRRKVIVFACSIQHGALALRTLRELGVKSELITSKSGKSARAQATADFRSGDLRALVNVNCLTTGFDVPDIDAIVMLRPTLSTGLYVQMVGRGMRTAPGKVDCLLLDYVGNIERHGSLMDITPDVSDIEFSDEPSGQVPKRTCGSCGSVIHQMARICGVCAKTFFDITREPSRINPTMAAWTERTLDQSMLSRGRAVDGDARAPVSDYPLMATDEVASYLDYGVTYVKQLRASDPTLKFYRVKYGADTGVGLRQVVYRREDVDAWVQSHPDRSNPESTQRKRVRDAVAA